MVCLALSAWLLLRLPDEPKAPALGETIVTYSTDTPDETKPDRQTTTWRGAAEAPKYITLPTIDAEGFIQPVGVDQHQQVAVPTNIHFAGWFADSVKPGERGLSIIDGHINGRGSDGIFANLGQLKTGDIYDIEFGDGTVREFRVIKVTTVDTNLAAGVLFSQDPKLTSQLNLITCGGSFDTTSRSYEQRVIVASEPVAD